MMFRTVIPLLLLLIPLLGWAEARNENIRVCGPYLMEMMTAMCPNGFNGIYQKRDSSGIQKKEVKHPEILSTEKRQDPVLSILEFFFTLF